MNSFISFVKRFKWFIIAAAAVIAILAVAFVSGGNLKSSEPEVTTTPAAATSPAETAQSTVEDTSKPNSTVATSASEKKPKATKNPTFASTVPETTVAPDASKPVTTTQAEKKAEPKPTAPKKTEPKETTTQALKCTFSISCSTILNHMDELDEDKHELVPSDGWIYSPSVVSFEEGDSVYDILLRVCRENNIQLESEWTPVYGSAYISGINNLYEFDCGRNSGWTYFVNDVFPNYGVSKYYPQNNDVIKFCYTCVKGDVGVVIE